MEIGWILEPKAWGLGHATEIAEAVIEYAFDQVDAPQAMARIAPGNAGSTAVARKLRMRLDRESSTGATLVFVRSREPVLDA